jgi:lipopolysaccharide/colanic/teichoic acid biosynthesis glycosyltransferase
MQKWKKYIFLSDIVSLYLALILAIIVRGFIHVHANQTEAVWFAAHTFIFLPAFLFSLVALYIAGLYDSKIVYDRAKTYVLLIYTQFATALFSVVSFYVLRTNLTPKLTIFFYVIFSITLLSLSRSYLFNKIQKLPKTRAVFFGKNKSLLEKLNPNYAPFNFVFLETKEEVAVEFETKNYNKGQYLVYEESILDLENLLFIESLKQKNVGVFSYNQYFEFLFKKVDFGNLYVDDLVRHIAESRETIAHYVFRRVSDIFVGLLILPFYLLTLPFVYLGIYFQDKGGILSIQDRVSFLGKRVWLYKVRTMTNTDVGGIVADDAKKNEKSKYGNTVTPFGKFLRKSRIDELPQCLNLLKGDISLIGPRADIIGVHEDMTAHIANYKLRLLVPQGLTGWAQVHMNFPPRTHEEHRERLAFELYYIRNRSVLLDISIILKTIKTLISREGA